MRANPVKKECRKNAHYLHLLRSGDPNVFDDHAPPHFHAYYGEYSAVIEIESLHLRNGRLPKRAVAMVLEWAAEHREELLYNWNLAQAHRPLNSIQPLE